MRAEQRAFLLAIGLFVLLGVCSAMPGTENTVTSLVDVISLKDQSRMVKALEATQPYDDVRSAYLIVKAVQAMGFCDGNKQLRQNACTYAGSHATPDLQNAFYIAAIKDMLKDSKEGCKIKLSDEAEKVVQNTFTGEPTVEELFYATSVMSYTAKKVDNTTVPQLLMSALENDDTPLSYGRAFHTAALIPNADLTDLFDQIEDIVAQADETPTTLYYDGGLKVTSMVVTGIFALSAHTGNAPALTETQATKFGNYFLSSKYTTVVDNLSYMMAAANALATNKFVIPSSLLVASNQPISQTNKNLVVDLTDILGRSVGPFVVRVNTITDSEGTQTKRGKPMSAGDTKSSYTYPLYNDLVDPGIYSVSLSTESKKTTAVVSLPNVEVQVALSFQVAVGSAQLFLKDRDQDVTTKTLSLSYPSTSTELLEVDQHSRVVMSFSLVNNNKKTKKVQVHQAFIRFSAKDKEIFYVTKYDAESGDYSFELDVKEAAADFGSSSDSYAMTLVVGDFAIENPFSWDVTTIKFKFPATTTPPVEPVDPYSALPVINHMFREPEKRPPVIISTTFTVLCLLPLSLLFLLWLILGANISNMSAGGIWTILFHLGLGAILALFYCFWLQLNMFQTLKYLAGLGAFTFLTGNRMLRNIAKSKQV